MRQGFHGVEDESLAIKVIAADLGYSSPSSFVRAFRHIGGVSPLTYRKYNSLS